MIAWQILTDQQVAAGNGVEDSEKVGVQRRLIEHLVPQPVASGDPLGPLVVGARVAHQDAEERCFRICQT